VHNLFSPLARVFLLVLEIYYLQKNGSHGCVLDTMRILKQLFLGDKGLYILSPRRYQIHMKSATTRISRAIRISGCTCGYYSTYQGVRETINIWFDQNKIWSSFMAFSLGVPYHSVRCQSLKTELVNSPFLNSGS
jgi:hypothetical protein